jgi:hypothetical protein
MKTPGELLDDAHLENWIGHSRWPGSLALATTCTCDVSQLGTDICEHLNAKKMPNVGPAVAFDREAIRYLAGNPIWRRRVLASLPEQPEEHPCCDYESMIRGVAQLGGAILAGRCCFDATRGLDRVFRVMVSNCGECRTDEPSMRLDPQRFSRESLVHVIADSFADWCRGLLPEEGAASATLRGTSRAPLVTVGA